MKANSSLALNEELHCPKCKRVLTSYRGEGKNHLFCPNGSCPVRKVIVVWQGTRSKEVENHQLKQVALVKVPSRSHSSQ